MMPNGGKSTSMPILIFPADLMLSTACANAVGAIAVASAPAPIKAIAKRLVIVMLIPSLLRASLLTGFVSLSLGTYADAVLFQLEVPTVSQSPQLTSSSARKPRFHAARQNG